MRHDDYLWEIRVSEGKTSKRGVGGCGHGGSGLQGGCGIEAFPGWVGGGAYSRAPHLLLGYHVGDGPVGATLLTDILID